MEYKPITGDKAFTESGFKNWLKAIEKSKAHEPSNIHVDEARMKWIARDKPTIAVELSSQVVKIQKLRREGLLVQLRAILYLTRQGIAIRGHTLSLKITCISLLQMWSKDNDVVKNWLMEIKSINELELLGLAVPHRSLNHIKKCNGPAWLSITADEAIEVNQMEQVNLSIHWVSDGYEVHEDPVGLI